MIDASPSPFALSRAATDVPCFCAIAHTVSPAATVCEAPPGAAGFGAGALGAGAADDDAGAAAILTESFCPG